MKVGDLVRKNSKEWKIEDCQQIGIITKIKQVRYRMMVFVTYFGEVWCSSYPEYELEVISESR